MPQLTATVDQYIGRSVDLLLYDGLSTNGEALLTPALVQPGQSGAQITGIQKLTQRFLLELFTEAGSMYYLPNRGCGFMLDARRGGWRTAADVEQSFYGSLLLIRRNLIGDESTFDYDDERFADAQLSEVIVEADRVSIRVQISSQAGNTREVLFPLRVNKL